MVTLWDFFPEVKPPFETLSFTPFSPNDVYLQYNVCFALFRKDVGYLYKV